MDQMYVEKAEEIISQLSGALLSITGLIFSRVIHSGFVAVHIISILLITPIVMFYLLLSWHTFTYRCLEVFPKKYRKYTNELFADINICISNLIRGQATVCLTLGVFYAIVFSVIGLESGIVLGIFSGILIFIPYLGALFSSFLCITIAAIQFDSLSYALIVGLTFAFGQTVESYFLTPTFIGRSVGLNPVWILFGLLSGGALFGLLGVLIALPLTATISVIIKFALKHYKKSKFYN